MLIMLASMLLIAISGIFYPITAMPTWLQWVGQIFPFYWLGLGTRSAMMPAGAEAAERPFSAMLCPIDVSRRLSKEGALQAQEEPRGNPVALRWA